MNSENLDLENAMKFLEDLENGSAKIIDAANGYKLNPENKEKILGLFKILQLQKMENDVFTWLDKVPLLKNYSGFRVVPGSIIRRGVFIDTDAVIMPSFINIGSHIGKKTMIDSGVTIGSCAYIGSGCHIASSTVIAGVLEPISAMPVVIEDDVFIGAHSLIAEGMRVKKGSVIASGVHLTSAVKIIDRATGEEFDHVPEYSVVVPGFYKSSSNSKYEAFIQCAWIVKKVDQQCREKTGINQILRSCSDNL